MNDDMLYEIWKRNIIVPTTATWFQRVPRLNIRLLIANGSIWNKRDINRRSARVS